MTVWPGRLSATVIFPIPAIRREGIGPPLHFDRMMAETSILLIDDEQTLCDLLANVLWRW
jgi:hypothetical protein